LFIRKKRRVNRLKKSYIFFISLLKKILAKFGFFKDRKGNKHNSVVFRWVESIFAIYDVEELINLDLPWWTFQATAEVEQFLKNRDNASVFEWGSGASTIWLARRAESIISIEHETKWFEKMQSISKEYSNITLCLEQPRNLIGEFSTFMSSKKGFENLDFQQYVTAISRLNKKFDLIVIDGRAREACFEIAINYLNKDGLIVFDNTNRSRYQKVINKKNHLLRVTTTKGLTVALPYPTKTSLIYKK
jgi:hypothetical protein